MKILKKTIAVILSVMMVVTVGIVCASAASTQTAPASDDTSTGITVHYKAKGTSVPTIYYWNSRC